MSNHSIKIGVIGAGGNTRSHHIPGLQAIDGVEIVGVCNRSHESSRKVAEQFGIPCIYDDWTQAVADPDTNAIVIGTWPYLHCRATLAALAANKHVMCEARMAMNAAEAHAMLEAAQSKPHLVAQVVPSPFTLRVDNTVRRLLAEGYLGQLLAIEVRAGGGFLDREAPLTWRQDPDLSGFNTLSLGIWYEAVLRWAGEATRVQAMGKTFVPLRRDANGVLRATNIPEHLDVIAEMACGAQAHFQVSSVTGLAASNEAILCGEAGTLRITGKNLYGGRRGGEEYSEIPIAPEEAGGWRVEEEFVNAIRGEEKITHSSFATGVKYMEFTEAVARSVASGQSVSLPLRLN
jgi:predicted dehydrogenase